MTTSTKRVVLSGVGALAASAAAVTFAAAPAFAGYTPGAVPSRSSAHHGGTVKISLSHFADHHTGKVVADKGDRTKVLKHFETNAKGGKIVSVTIPKSLKKGKYTFVVTVGHKNDSFKFKVL